MFYHVSDTATMSRFLYVAYSEKEVVFDFDRTCIVSISSEPGGPGFKLTSPASGRRIANLKYGREGGSGSNM